MKRKNRIKNFRWKRKLWIKWWKNEKKCESLKIENEKLTQNYNLIKKENNENFIKYESIRKEKEIYLLNKEENKTKIKDKEKQIKLINDQIKIKENKNEELMKKIENFEKNNKNENLPNINELYKEIFKNNLEEIELLKQKIQKFEEKFGILNKNNF